METIQELIVRLRKKKGYTQQQLAEKMGTSQSYIGRIEKGIEIPGPAMIKKMAKAFKTPILKFKLAELSDLIAIKHRKEFKKNGYGIWFNFDEKFTEIYSQL